MLVRETQLPLCLPLRVKAKTTHLNSISGTARDVEEKRSHGRAAWNGLGDLRYRLLPEVGPLAMLVESSNGMAWPRLQPLRGAFPQPVRPFFPVPTRLHARNKRAQSSAVFLLALKYSLSK